MVWDGGQRLERLLDRAAVAADQGAAGGAARGRAGRRPGVGARVLPHDAAAAARDRGAPDRADAVLRRRGAGAGLHAGRDGALRLQPVAGEARGGAEGRRRVRAGAGGGARGERLVLHPNGFAIMEATEGSTVGDCRRLEASYRREPHSAPRRAQRGGGAVAGSRPSPHRHALGVEAVEVLLERADADVGAPGDRGLALLADEDRLLGADVDEEVVVGAEVLGVDDLALPGRVVVVDDDVLGADAEGVAAVSRGRSRRSGSSSSGCR